MKKEIFKEKFLQSIYKQNWRVAGKNIILLLLLSNLIGGFTRSVDSVFAVSEIACLSAPLNLNSLVFESAAQRYYAEQSEAGAQEKLLRRITPGLNQLISVLDEYQSERIISRYYLSGSFLRGKIREDQDIDLAVSFRRYDNPEALQRLLGTAAEISKRTGFTFHITLQAFGFEYELQSGRIIYTGDIRSENIVARSVDPEEQSLLRIDNLNTVKYAEDFWVKLFRQCRVFDFKQQNINQYIVTQLPAFIAQKTARIQKLYDEVTEEDAYPAFTKTFDAQWKQVGIFLTSEIDSVDKILNAIPIGPKTKAGDLGCGIGQVCALLAARGAYVTGYEIDKKLTLVSDWLVRDRLKSVIDSEKVQFLNGDFLEQDLSDFDVLFYYWNSSRNPYQAKLQEKILKELKPGAFLLVYGAHKEENYFPGMVEEIQLPGYAEIRRYARIYRQISRDDRGQTVKINAFEVKSGERTIENEDLYNIKKLKDGILYNSLIQKFFKLSETYGVRQAPWSLVLYKLLEPDSDFMKEVIEQVEAKGEAWISQQGEIIRETHSSRSSYTDINTGGSWTAFIDNTKEFERYNLAHLLAHSIGYVKNYIEIDEVEKAQEFFKTGYIILRAIEIESRKTEKQHNTQIQMLQDNVAFLEKSGKVLPKVKLKKLNENQAFIMADRLSELFEDKNIHFLDDALDISPKYAYSAKVIDNIEVVFLGQDPDTLYSSIGVSLVPDTYYIAITEGDNIIGYGAIDAVVMREDDSIGIAFRIFDKYRHRKGKISAQIFKFVLAGAREIFGQKITKFILPSHQINGERGIESSAVIFYLKLGFELTDKNLQALWENKYSAKVSAGEQLDKTVIENISQSRIIFDLNKPNIPHDSIFPQVEISVLGIEHNLMVINQAI